MMGKNWKNSEISDAQVQEDRKINNFWWYLAIATLIIIALFFISIIFICMYFIDFIIIVFKYFEKSEQIIQFIMSLIGSLGLKGLAVLIMGLFSYFYFFEYIKNKGVKIPTEDEKEGKYFGFILSFYAIFNFILILPLILYLYIVKGVIFESCVILFFYIVTRLVFGNIIDIYNKILHDYNSLHKLNPSDISRELKSLKEKTWNKLKEIRSKPRELILSKRILGYINIKALRDGVIWYILLKTSSMLKAIFTLIFLVAFFGIILEFNILSLIYIELTLIFWYFVLSAVSHLPNKVSNIALNTGEILKEVYIIEDSSKGHIFVLTPQNKLIKIMKNSIITVE